MVHTHTVMLTRDECYVHTMVSVTCEYIHVDGFTFDSHECVNDVVSMTCANIHDNGFTFDSHVLIHITNTLVINRCSHVQTRHDVI